MARRTTIELDEQLLADARQALGTPTTRATVEEALRRVTASAETEAAQRRARQLEMLERLPESLDVDVLASGEMWR